MRIQQIAATGLIGWLAVLAIGCSKMSADEEADLRKSFGLPPDVPMLDLGVVELRAGIPNRVRVGWGKYCTLTATRLTNDFVQINLLYESESEVMDGVRTPHHSAQSKSVFRPGRRGRFCFPQMGRHLVVAVEPVIIP
jgi:hypothetical protein